MKANCSIQEGWSENTKTLFGYNDSIFTYTENGKNTSWNAAQIPIEVLKDEIKIRPTDMLVSKVYHFVWNGAEIFAIRRGMTNQVDFYVVENKVISNG